MGSFLLFEHSHFILVKNGFLCVCMYMFNIFHHNFTPSACVVSRSSTSLEIGVVRDIVELA